MSELGGTRGPFHQKIPTLFFQVGGQFYSLIKDNLTKAKPKKNW